LFEKENLFFKCLISSVDNKNLKNSQMIY
jgi:hypothetical protein